MELKAGLRLVERIVARLLGLSRYRLDAKLALLVAVVLASIPVTIILVDRSIYPFIALTQVLVLLTPLAVKVVVDKVHVGVFIESRIGVEGLGSQLIMKLANESTIPVRIVAKLDGHEYLEFKPKEAEIVVEPKTSRHVYYRVYGPVGRHKLPPLKLYVGSGLGLVYKEVTSNGVEVRFRPRIDLVRLGLKASTEYYEPGTGFRSILRGLGYDFQGLREYVYGDPVKLVDWKSTARLRKLLVKEFSVETGQSIAIALFIDDKDFDTSFYSMIARTISTLSHTLILRGASLSLLVASPNHVDYVMDVKGLKQFHRILDLFANVPWTKGSIPLNKALNKLYAIILGGSTKPRLTLIFTPYTCNIVSRLVEFIEKALFELPRVRILVPTKCMDELEVLSKRLPLTSYQDLKDYTSIVRGVLGV